MASKLRFFFFFASNRVGEEGGRRGMRSSWLLIRAIQTPSMVPYLKSSDWVLRHLRHARVKGTGSYGCCRRQTSCDRYNGTRCQASRKRDTRKVGHDFLESCNEYIDRSRIQLCVIQCRDKVRSSMLPTACPCSLSESYVMSSALSQGAIFPIAESVWEWSMLSRSL
jgi:hypothetical protein